MTPEELIESYNILSQNVKDQAARDAAIIGNSQRSLGPLAARVASPTGQTSGLANYTYNRLMRPVVDSTAAALTTQGTAQALNKNLGDALRAARAAYEDAQNKYTVASTTPSATGLSGILGLTEASDNTLGNASTVEDLLAPVPEAGTLISSSNNGNGSFDFVVANGDGTTHIVNIIARSQEEANRLFQQKYGNSNPSTGGFSGR